MLLLIDNYDSFTWNLVQYFSELGAEVVVRRNDALTLQELDGLHPTQLVISPGPCTPNEAGISLAAIAHCAGRIPILGVCLGHQAIAQVLGGRVVRADAVMHGKTSPIHHVASGVFQDLPSPFAATRYHSLVVARQSLPAELAETAWTERDGQREYVMALRHNTLPIAGVQFHPESILTMHGHQLLKNFLTDI